MNDIEKLSNWLEKSSNPVKKQLDKIFQNIAEKYEANYDSEMYFEDVNEPISWYIGLNIDNVYDNINVLIRDLYNPYDIKFDEEYLNNFNILDADLTIIVSSGFKNNELEMDYMGGGKLLLFVDTLEKYGSEFYEHFSSIMNKPKNELDLILYELTDDPQYLPKDVQDIFVF